MSWYNLAVVNRREGVSKGGGNEQEPRSEQNNWFCLAETKTPPLTMTSSPRIVGCVQGACVCVYQAEGSIIIKGTYAVKNASNIAAVMNGAETTAAAAIAGCGRIGDMFASS